MSPHRGSGNNPSLRHRIALTRRDKTFGIRVIPVKGRGHPLPDSLIKPSRKTGAARLVYARSLDILSLGTLFARHDLEDYLFALVQCFKALPKDGRVVDKNILAAV